MKRIFTAFSLPMFMVGFSALLPLNARGGVGDTFEVDEINYVVLTPETVAVDEGDYEGDIVIPSTVEYDGEEYTVTEIGERAFQDSSITTIELPETLTKIGDWAFLDSWDLEEIYVPDGVTYVGFYAFGCCYAMESCRLPEGLTVLEEELFRDDFYLETVNIPSTVTQILEDAFYGCDGLMQLELPDGLEVIGDYAFAETGLTSIELPDGLTELGYSCFQNCFKLTDVTLPSNLETLTASAFYNCRDLEAITIPANVKNIGGSAFALCSKLKNINVLATVPPVIAKESAFASATYSDAEVIVPNGSDAAYKAADFWSLFQNLHSPGTVGVNHIEVGDCRSASYRLDGCKADGSARSIIIRDRKKIVNK